MAWRTFDGEGSYDYRSYEMNENYAAEWVQRNPKHKGWVDPLYTAPPQREWHPLTKAEIKVLWNAANSYGEFAQLIEAKLKEKNG